MNIKKIFEQLIEKKNLSTEEMREIINECMTGALTDVQIVAFLVLMRAKGETIDELSTAAIIMKELANKIDLGSNLVDIVGTGGDNKNTFNVSTISSFVASAAGLQIAKHGNRASSSKSGSADLLIEAGFKLTLSNEALKQCIQKCNIAFLFGPHFHEAMQHAKSARLQLGVRTLFNLLGPLINPANVKKQVVGVFSKDMLKPLATVLANLGSERSLVLSSQDGLDEISISAKTDILEYRDSKFTSWSIDPKDFDCFHPNINDIIVDSPEASLKIANEVFKGEKGPARDIILLNSAAAIYCGLDNISFAEAIKKAITAIDSGEAYNKFIQLRDLTRLTHD